jgi:hypothetical protein
MRTYPIVKYPKLIIKNLRTQQQKSIPQFARLAVCDSDRQLTPQLPRSNGVELLLAWVLGGWAMMLLAIVLKLMTAGVLIAAIALTIGAGIKYWNATLKSARPQRQQPQARVRNPDPISVPIPIDWSGVTANLMRSDVPSEAQKGVSEAFFLTHLQAHFSGWVDYGKVYQPSGWDEKYAYSADIELLLPCGLGIQIEIDEPYDGKTGSPHHCYDSGKDRQRDDFFLGGNWVIIRLSERQVVESPLACCGVIAERVLELTQDERWRGLAVYAQEIKPERCWNTKVAKQKADRQERREYLERTGLWAKLVKIPNDYIIG